MSKREKRAVAAALTTAIALGCSVPAQAGDTLPYLGDSAKGENQPYQHGYRGEDFLNWDYKSDRYAEYLRAKVPLNDRNKAFAATQANPKLSPETEMFALSGDYGNAFFDSYPYTNEFSQYLFNFWQYTDYYASWHGMPTQEVPEEMYQDERGVTDAWKNRKFEFGLVNLPNPAYTNAAHKNGVLSIGCIFLPRTGLKHAVLLTQDKDGNFPYADKLAEICDYFGFDGWFINQEEDIPKKDIELYKQFMKQMIDKGLYVQWYDSVIDTTGEIDYQNEFNELNSSFVSDGKDRFSSSIFLNYWWNAQMLQNSAKHAKELGLNPLEAVFVGVEGGKDRFNQEYNLRDNLDENGQPLNSIATLGADFVHHAMDEDFDGGISNNVAIRREKDEFQWIAFERERRWWSGPYSDPSKANTTEDQSKYPENPDIAITGEEKQNFDGIAAYITERSVINSDTFVTNFNTGHGLEYNLGGSVSNEHEWSNINIQDILPTWQWWVESQDGDKKLKVDFDYGTKYKKNYNNGQKDVLGKEGKFDFDLVGAYNGGSSLVVYGDINSENLLHLYKTDLDVKANSKAQITYKKTSNDDVKMQLAVVFADAPNDVVKIDLTDKSSADGWTVCEADLSKYAGKKIASLNLAFSGNAEDYQINIGKLAYTSGKTAKPSKPSGLKIDSVFNTGEMYISWNLDDYKDVKQYNVYANINGKDMYMGGIYDNFYYIKDIYDAKGEVTIKVTAVSEDGTESEPATVSYNLENAVSDISVKDENGKLNVSWKANSGANVSLSEIYTDDKETELFNQTVGKDVGSVVITLPEQTKDYGYYTLKIKSENGETLTYNGRLPDSYCTPYKPDLSHGIKGYRLTVPEQKDWYKMIVKSSDGNETTVVRYSNEMPYVDPALTYTVVLEDYTGNSSEPVSFKIENNKAVIVDGSSVPSKPETSVPVLNIGGETQVKATNGALISVETIKTENGYSLNLKKISGDGENNTIKVALPVENACSSTVVAVIDDTGNKNIIKNSYTDKNGNIVFSLNQSCNISVYDNKKSFKDVSSDKWYANSVDFVTSHELFSGTSADKFSPSSSVNRAMLTTVLYRLAGEPETDKKVQFTDVKENQYFADAVAWAVNNSIVTGTSEKTFSPNSSITREQIAAILYRYSGSPSTTQSLDKFSDSSKVSSYAVNAVKWAVENGLLSGKNNNKLDPKGTATRAEAATMLMRFISI